MSTNVRKLPPKDMTLMENIIEARLRGLGINGFSIGDKIEGPIITGYPIKLSLSTSLASIINKSEELAIACGVESINIQRIGSEVIIFVPNSERKIIDFKDALFWMMKDEKVLEMKIPLILGMDYQGNNSAIDLVKQPHVLIAGSTGSGKSIFESAIIASIAMLKTPEELHIYIVDPKRVDLTMFYALPHVKKVVKDINEWYSLINYLYDEVQNRQKFLEKSGCRNIDEYNSKHPKKMAYKLLIIDELADLIEKDKYNREEQKANQESMDLKVIDSIQRLIQVCRASGVHIIACTQRTTVDIVKGTVKANFPTRISLKLPQRNDSVAILGENGAESLLGKGDMLIKSGDSDNLKRYHAPFVKISDIEYILSQREQIMESLGVN